MIESGIIDSWISDLVANSSNCDTKAKILSSHKRQFVHLTLVETERFFLMIIVGLILSVFGLLAEISKAKHERDRNYLKMINQIKKKRMRIAMLKIATFKVLKEVKNNSMANGT